MHARYLKRKSEGEILDQFPDGVIREDWKLLMTDYFEHDNFKVFFLYFHVGCVHLFVVVFHVVSVHHHI